MCTNKYLLYASKYPPFEPSSHSNTEVESFREYPFPDLQKQARQILEADLQAVLGISDLTQLVMDYFDGLYESCVFGDNPMFWEGYSQFLHYLSEFSHLRFERRLVPKTDGCGSGAAILGNLVQHGECVAVLCRDMYHRDWRLYFKLVCQRPRLVETYGRLQIMYVLDEKATLAAETTNDNLLIVLSAFRDLSPPALRKSEFWRLFERTAYLMPLIKTIDVREPRETTKNCCNLM